MRATGVALLLASAGCSNAPLGLDRPASAVYDPDADVYLVSNMAGVGDAEDGNGFIARLRPKGPCAITGFAAASTV